MAVFGVILVRNFPAFCCIRTEYGEIQSWNAGKCKKNADQNNSEYAHFLCSVESSSQFQSHRMSEFPCYRKSMKKHKHSKVICFLHISREAEIHAIPKRWDEWIPILYNKHGKTQTISSFCSSFRVDENSWIPITWKYSVENLIVPRLWVFEEIWAFFCSFQGK